MKLEGLAAVMLDEVPSLRLDTAKEIFHRTLAVWGETTERTLHRCLRRLIDAGYVERCSPTPIDQRYRKARLTKSNLEDELLSVYTIQNIVRPRSWTSNSAGVAVFGPMGLRSIRYER